MVRWRKERDWVQRGHDSGGIRRGKVSREEVCVIV